MTVANSGVNGVEKVKPMRSSPASPRWARRAVSVACSDSARMRRASSRNSRARLRQPHRALVALEQLRAQFRFQRLDLLAQRRLADVQALGRAREVQLLGDGDKVAQVAQFHISNRFKV